MYLHLTSLLASKLFIPRNLTCFSIAYPQNPHLISLYSLITKSLLYTLKLIHRIITWFSIAYSQKPYFLPNCYFTECSRWRGPGTRKPYSSYRMTIFSHTKFVNFKIRVLRYCWNFFRIFVITNWQKFRQN